MAKKKKVDYNKIAKDLSKNYWAVSTMVLAILLVATLISGGISGATISANDAGQRVLTFANNQGANATLISVNNTGSLYEVVLSIKGQEVPVYTTKDGKNLVPSLIPLETTAKPSSASATPSKEIPKADKPKVELYVFTYCPYGTQSEKGLLPVIKLLGDKVDFKIRQIGAMHGAHEELEAKRQLCIEKEAPTKLLDYVEAFALNSEIGACRGNAECVNPMIDALYAELGIDKAKVDSCIESDGDALYAAEEQNAKANGIGGSPTLVINGVKSQIGRDSASYLAGICTAFNTTPEECDETVSSTAPSPGFGGSTSAASTSAQC